MTIAVDVIVVEIYFWLGLKFRPKTRFNLHIVSAISLIAVDIFGLHGALNGH